MRKSIEDKKDYSDSSSESSFKLATNLTLISIEEKSETMSDSGEENEPQQQNVNRPQQGQQVPAALFDMNQLQQMLGVLMQNSISVQQRELEDREQRVHRRAREDESRQIQISNAVSAQCKLIEKFDKEKIAHFLETVRTVYNSFTQEEAKAMVLNIAKLRLPINSEIANSEYENFAEFQTDVLNKFRPPESVAHMRQQIALLMQKPQEKVSDFTKRAQKMMEKFVDAMFVRTHDKGHQWTEEKQEEAEETVREQFVLGLKAQLRPFVNGSYATLSHASAAAEKAESNEALQKMLLSSRQNSDETEQKGQVQQKKFTKFKKPFKKPFQKKEGEQSQPKEDGAKPEGDGKPTCFNCGKKGHKAPECRQPKKVKNFNAKAREQDSDDDDYADDCSKNGPSGSQSVKAATLKIGQYSRR